MRAEEILLRGFQRELVDVHLARVRLVFAAVHTLLRSGRLALTSLGRAIATRTSPKHGIKRIDRLLGNLSLHAERLHFYRALARRLIGRGSRPSIIVDWTSVTPHIWALVAAVPHQGRALIVYAETHGIGSYLKPSVNSAFLNRLRSVLPPCSPIIITDAGFRGPWMRLVESYGWHFISRMRGRSRIRRSRAEAWTDLDYLWQRTSDTPRDFGSFEVAKMTRFRTRVVGVSKKAKYDRLPKKRDYGSARQKRAAREPWLLATSLRSPASRIVAIYSQRMQIEETFRDAKSHRYGICLNYARTKSTNRADLLVLLAAMAHAVSVLVGLAAEASGLQRRYQANTVKTRRVLSLAMLGRMALAAGAAALLYQGLSRTRWRALRISIMGQVPP